MKQYISLLITLLLLCLSSCSNDVTGDAAVLLADGECSYAMTFDGNITDYSADVVSRASTVSVSNGDKMYMVFYNSGGTKVNYGTSTYSSGKWTVIPNSKFSTGSGTVKLYYFVGASSATSTSVTCNAKTAVYECTSGTWSVASNAITVKGTLIPKYCRIHFRGSSSTSFTLGTMTVPGSYSISDGSISTKLVSSTSLSVSSSSSSDYVYFDGASLTDLAVTVSGVTYTKNSVPSLSSVKSIIVNLPVASNYVGWSSSDDKLNAPEEYEPVASDHEAVDLGLSVKWATCNVGASKPEDYGLYFAWGETVGYGSDTSDGRLFDWSSYKWCNGSYNTMTKYCTLSSYGTVDNKTTLDKEDDAASVNWGGNWRMPTYKEQDELCTKCTWTWTSMNGVKGYRVTGPNGNSIFLPAAGYRDDTDLDFAGSLGDYWSSSLYEDYSNYAWYVGFNSGLIGRGGYYRYLGRSVRAVCP